MKHKKGKFLTFCFSCIPGAGQMYLGFFKEGVSLMTTFIGIIIISSWLYLDIFSLGAVVVWFYAFFDAMNKNSMPDEEFAELEDDYIWGDNLDCLQKLTKGNGRKLFAVVLICFGGYMLLNSIVSVLAGAAGIYISYEVNQFLTRYVPQIVVAFIIIAGGVRMIMGKKEEIEFDDEKYFEGRDEK